MSRELIIRLREEDFPQDIFEDLVAIGDARIDRLNALPAENMRLEQQLGVLASRTILLEQSFTAKREAVGLACNEIVVIVRGLGLQLTPRQDELLASCLKTLERIYAESIKPTESETQY